MLSRWVFGFAVHLPKQTPSARFKLKCLFISVPGLTARIGSPPGQHGLNFEHLSSTYLCFMFIFKVDSAPNRKQGCLIPRLPSKARNDPHPQIRFHI